MKTRATVLAIETSCDETAVALLTCQRTRGNYALKLHDHLLHSQVRLHAKTGGVVPEVAAREHAVRLPQLLHELGRRYSIAQLRRMVDAIAVTAGPGLVTSLLTGVEVARGIALAWNKPLVPVNHLEGHIYANLLPTHSHRFTSTVGSLKLTTPSNRQKTANSKLQTVTFRFPLLALIVSGGHTELVLMRDHLRYRLLGATRDDAAGEAFDKTAKLLGLPYPGGPALSRLAERGQAGKIVLPRPMLDQKNFDFSFSGLKTAVALTLRRNRKVARADVAAEIECAIVATLVEKTCRAALRHQPAMIVLAGGVAANARLRHDLMTALQERVPDAQFLKPAVEFATDNGAMIAAAGAIRFLNGFGQKASTLVVDPQLALQ